MSDEEPEPEKVTEVKPAKAAKEEKKMEEKEEKKSTSKKDKKSKGSESKDKAVVSKSGKNRDKFPPNKQINFQVG